jgi:hypothetical protein
MGETEMKFGDVGGGDGDATTMEQHQLVIIKLKDDDSDDWIHCHE